MFITTVIMLTLVSNPYTDINPSEAPIIDSYPAVESGSQWNCPDVAGYVQAAYAGRTAELYSDAGRSVDLFPGWPVSVLGFNYRGGIYCNMDSDTLMEIVFTTGEEVCAWNLDGSVVAGWPCSLNLFSYRAPAFGDVDGDGFGEIVVTTRFPGTGNTGWLHVFETDGSNTPGFPLFLVNGGASGTPALADLNADGALEIIIAERSWPDGWISVYKGDGSFYPGWPQAMDHVPGSAAAVGDINGDGVPEIVGESFISVYAFDADGGLLSGFPYTPGGDNVFSYSSPSLADLDSDGNREIIVGDHNTSTGDGQVHVIHSDGTIMTGWPRSTIDWVYSPPSIGDVDGDGEPDVVIADHGLSGSPCNYVYAWDRAGIPLSGFPIGPVWGVNSQVILADIDGDQQVELLFDDNSSAGGIGHYHGYNHDGSMMAGWPLATTGSTFFINPFVADLNLDGDMDIVGAGSIDDYLHAHVWDANSQMDENHNYLTMLQYNVRHDGVYTAPMTGIEENQWSALPQLVNLRCMPNPFSANASISFEGVLPGVNVTVSIYDIHGRLVHTVGTEVLSGNETVTVNWDGRDSSGRSVSSGVYYITVSNQTETLAAEKIALLR